MEIARLVLDFCKVLVWPLVVLVIAHSFRDEVRGLLRRIRNLSAVGVDAEFSEAVEHASAGAEAAVRERSEAEPSASDSDAAPPAALPRPEAELWRAVANLEAPEAMVAAWDQVESTLVGMLPGYRRVGELTIQRLIMSDRYFPRDIAEALAKLKVIRNEVAHQRRTPTVEAARDYVASCEAMVDWLNEYEQSPAWTDAASELVPSVGQ